MTIAEPKRSHCKPLAAMENRIDDEVLRERDKDKRRCEWARGRRLGCRRRIRDDDAPKNKRCDAAEDAEKGQAWPTKSGPPADETAQTIAFNRPTISRRKAMVSRVRQLVAPYTSYRVTL